MNAAWAKAYNRFCILTDITDFVRASDRSYSVSSHTSPGTSSDFPLLDSCLTVLHTLVSPFNTTFRTAPSSSPLEQSPPTGVQTGFADTPLIRRLSRTQSPPPLQARRLNGKGNALSISDLPPRNSPPASIVALPSAGASTATDGGPEASASQVGPVSTEQRMRTLPRLLSSDAYNFASMRSSSQATSQPVAEESEPGDSEDHELETETDGESEGEEEGTANASGTSRVMTAEDMMVPESRQSPRPAGQHTPGAAPFFTPRTSQSSIPGWVTFGGSTPTPGPQRTARITGDGVAKKTESYFDIRQVPTTPRTPGQPLMTPLLPQSLSMASRGQRPTRQDEQQQQTRSTTTSRERGSEISRDERRPNMLGDNLGSQMYRRRSASAVAILSPSMLDEDDQPLGTAALTGLDPVWHSTNGARTPGPSFINQTPAAATPKVESGPVPLAGPKTPVAHAAMGSPIGSRLHRRRSMYELPTAPPAYHAVYKRPAGPAQIVYPREEEGHEGLPGYTCAVHLEGYMPRKMEFTAPSVQARDRSWKRVYVVLHGTSIKFYKYDLRTHPIAGEQDFSGATIEMAGNDGPPPLHFHAGEYGVEESSTTSKFPLSVADAKAKAKSKIVQATSASDANNLIRHYSLQNAEVRCEASASFMLQILIYTVPISQSGLAADYIKVSFARQETSAKSLLTYMLQFPATAQTCRACPGRGRAIPASDVG